AAGSDGRGRDHVEPGGGVRGAFGGWKERGGARGGHASLPRDRHPHRRRAERGAGAARRLGRRPGRRRPGEGDRRRGGV
ncbi:MAG: hypothetical protein AVDCRST_MAG89-593, partial [uncultured Gemmatimonadetes bacterium]